MSEYGEIRKPSEFDPEARAERSGSVPSLSHLREIESITPQSTAAEFERPQSPWERSSLAMLDEDVDDENGEPVSVNDYPKPERRGVSVPYATPDTRRLLTVPLTQEVVTIAPPNGEADAEEGVNGITPVEALPSEHTEDEGSTDASPLEGEAPKESVAVRFGRIIDEKNISRAGLARAAGIHDSSLSRFLNEQLITSPGVFAAMLQAAEVGPEEATVLVNDLREEKERRRELAKKAVPSVAVPEGAGDEVANLRKPRVMLPALDQALKERQVDIASLLPPRAERLKEILPTLVGSNLSNAKLGEQLGVTEAQISLWRARIVDHVMNEVNPNLLPEQLREHSPRAALQKLVVATLDNPELEQLLPAEMVHALPYLAHSELSTKEIARVLAVRPGKVIEMRNEAIAKLSMLDTAEIPESQEPLGTVGPALDAVCKRANLTRAQITEATGLTESTLSRFFAGKTLPPSASVPKPVADFLLENRFLSILDHEYYMSKYDTERSARDQKVRQKELPVTIPPSVERDAEVLLGAFTGPSSEMTRLEDLSSAHLGARINMLRTERGWRVDDLAQKSGISTASLYRFFSHNILPAEGRALLLLVVLEVDRDIARQAIDLAYAPPRDINGHTVS